MKIIRLRQNLRDENTTKSINIEIIQDGDDFMLVAIKGDSIGCTPPKSAHCKTLMQAKNKARLLTQNARAKGFEFVNDEADLREEVEECAKPKLSLVKN